MPDENELYDDGAVVEDGTDNAAASAVAAGPSRPVLQPDDPLTKLRAGVRSALASLPGEFDFPHPVSGVNATDLFNLNTFLGAGIELEVVRTLNGLRNIWDPTADWSEYRFERSSQAFPDVRLVKRSVEGAEHIALGIELKGWWMLSKEGVPSLRYQVSPTACAEHDLICVVPWYLSSAVSGMPQVAEPWVESARYAAEWRDHWWTNIRDAQGTDPSVSYPPDASPYPSKADRVLAVPAYDRGGNFGRLPRSRPLMDEFIRSTKATPILGITTGDWISFLSLSSSQPAEEEVLTALQRKLQVKNRRLAPGHAEAIKSMLDELKDLL